MAGELRYCQVHPVSIHGEPFAWCPDCRKHNCYFQGKLGELIFICSRCSGCYICTHKFEYFDAEGVWKVKCNYGKLKQTTEPIINDGKIYGPPLPTGPCPTHGEICHMEAQ